MKNNKIQDSVLIRNYRNGSEADFRVLLERHHLFLFNVIQSKVLNKQVAEDIFQETFIKAITLIKRGDYKEEGKFLPWILRIANNLIIDHFRREKRMQKYTNVGDFDIFYNLKDNVLNAEKKLINNQDAIIIKNLLEYLPEEQKHVLVMRMQYNMSFKSISEQTGVSINTSLGRMRYGINNLKKLFEQVQ